MLLHLEEIDETIQRTTSINFKKNIEKQMKLLILSAPPCRETILL